MPVVGVEPTRVISTRDFESPSSAIPTHRRGLITDVLYRILPAKSRKTFGGGSVFEKEGSAHRKKQPLPQSRSCR